MIGNDLVDRWHSKEESNWKRKGYLNKIYTLSEQLLIDSASDAEVMVWILWSMKEAAYKANHRITSVREYAPIKITCEIKEVKDQIYFGIVTYNNLQFQTKTCITEDYIHTIALHNSSDFSTLKEILIQDYPTNYIEYLIQHSYLAQYEKIVKDEFGIPNLYNELSDHFRPMSISHHGNFLSIIIR